MNRAVMGQSVQQGRGQGGIAEHAAPLRKRRFDVTIREPFSYRSEKT